MKKITKSECCNIEKLTEQVERIAVVLEKLYAEVLKEQESDGEENDGR